jgi:hypothetical protein
MTAKELRIGNYVNYMVLRSYMQGVVRTINNATCNITGIGLSSPIGSIKFSMIEGIPLTEEWLLKFGFKKPAHSFICDIFHLSEWDEFKNNWCVAMNKNNAVVVLKLKHVHQLQNLYFALTGEELMINQ